jgi:hypothetical protein
MNEFFFANEAMITGKQQREHAAFVGATLGAQPIPMKGAAYRTMKRIPTKKNSLPLTKHNWWMF